jgi:xylulokinase
MLNSPGNFTASKLKWVKDNEPDIYERADKILLPGDFIAMKLTGEVNTTISGLTEGIFWDFKERKLADDLLNHLNLKDDLIAPTVPTFSIQGKLSKRAAEETGLKKGTPLCYRAGDQPNNALSLNVLHPGEIAATSGTSGVVYGIVDRPVFDPKSRVNAFAHVNYEEAFNRIGVLLCLNGAGIQYSWLKHQVARGSHTYADMERMAASVPVGSDGLCVLPFGNGAERMLENKEPNAHIFNLQFNRHTRGHIYRAALEGVAFSFAHGINILKEMDMNVDVIRVGNDNMFQSKTFSKTLATLLDIQIEVVETTGAIGAAKAAGIAAGMFKNLEEALAKDQPTQVFDPTFNKGLCEQAYSYWLSNLEKALSSPKHSDKASFAVMKQNERLEKELKKRNRSLAANALQIDSLKENISDLQSELTKLIQQDKSNKLLKQIQQKLDKLVQHNTEWASFEEHFNFLHSNFFEKIKEVYPNLSIPELKMCAYLKMGLSNKEMSQRLNLSIRGVETRRYRLSKKLNSSPDFKLIEFLKNLD